VQRERADVKCDQLALAWLTCAALSLSLACATRESFCSLDLRAAGWSRTTKPDGKRIESRLEGADSEWFMNARGDYFVCHNVRRGVTCGGIYEEFTRRDDGTFDVQVIVCTT
jgi:hypothetical protein